MAQKGVANFEPQSGGLLQKLLSLGYRLVTFYGARANAPKEPFALHWE
jgi:hypothetical protein